MYIEIVRVSEDTLQKTEYFFSVRVDATMRDVTVCLENIKSLRRASRRHRSWVTEWVYRHLWRRGSQTWPAQVFEHPGMPEDVLAELREEIQRRTRYNVQ